MNTSLKVSLEANSGKDFYLLLGDFLDEFYVASDSEVRSAMLAETPVDMQGREYLAFIAATAHKLANDYHLETPSWTFERRCFLPPREPFFACRASGDLRLYFMYVSPGEFKHRNLFVDMNVLARV